MGFPLNAIESFAAHGDMAGDTFCELRVEMLIGALGAPPLTTSTAVFAIGSTMISTLLPLLNVSPVLPSDVLFIDVVPSLKIPNELPPACPR
jgi:hypothetical protein